MTGLQDEQIEIIIGDSKTPTLHLISTVGNLNEALGIMLIPTTKPLVAPHVSMMVKEPVEIRKIRHEFRLKKDEVRYRYNKEIAQLNFEEEVVVDKKKTEIAHGSQEDAL